MKKRKYFSIAIIMGAFLFSGCKNAIPEMSEEERVMVVNYAADIVQKYDSNHTFKLQMMTPAPEIQETEENKAEENKEAMQEEISETQTTDSEQETNTSDAQGAEVIDNAAEIPEVSLDGFLQIPSFHFDYAGYETSDSYPAVEADASEMYFSFDASEGSQLLILKFTAENQSGEEQLLDMVSTKIRFKIQIDGEVKNALTTMLLNDFANYQTTMAPGESTELVVICEVPKEQAGNIGSLALILKKDDETATISL